MSGWLIEAAPATEAKLLVSHTAARAGGTVMAGVRLRMAAGWHIYWRNPGESGMPTAIKWTLPAGIEAGEIQWPVPGTHESGGLTTYVYEREVMLLAPLKLAATLAAGEVELKAEVSWLECQEACVPGATDLKAVLQVGPQDAASPDAALIEAWRKQLPATSADPHVMASWAAASGDTRTLVIEGRVPANEEAPVDFYPYGGPGYEVSPKVSLRRAEAGRFRIEKSVKLLGDAPPASLAGLLVRNATAGRRPEACEVALDLKKSSSPAAIESDSPGGRRLASDGGVPTTGKPQGLLAMLGLAFLGGLILNVMPCVLPVIALKILGFVQQSKEAPGRVRQLGLLYAAGVLVSFMVLAAMVIAVRQGGGAASWGMQMQNPYFRLALTVVVLLVTLNLFGVFEVALGSGAMGAAAGLAARGGATGAFFNGVLATALATPCTAPFLTVALGFAFTQSAGVVLLMFAATAAGLAAPYVVLSWRPGWLRFLPKPGAWMQRFKVAMAFPMLAVAVWLFDLTAPSFGQGGVLWLGLFLTMLALAAWVWGEFVQRGTERRALAAVVCVACVALGYAYALEGQLRWRNPPASPVSGSGIVQDVPGGIEWRPWNTAAVEQVRAQGRVVLVDFTAKWCLTCKSNKKFAIDVPEVRAKIKELNAVAFRADNTDPNPAIAAELKRYQRAGVPLVLVFPAEAQKAPVVLPALLTPALVLDGLTQAAR